MVGIVTALDGKSILKARSQPSSCPGHDNFQNAQLFIEAGGRRSLRRNRCC
ncbi:MAG: hypothetical protein IPK19_25170 [Chloroflexi bacterium]|nr:hypothetical protein [Chloroflexota bacterium]